MGWVDINRLWSQGDLGGAPGTSAIALLRRVAFISRCFGFPLLQNGIQQFLAVWEDECLMQWIQLNKQRPGLCSDGCISSKHRQCSSLIHTPLSSIRHSKAPSTCPKPWRVLTPIYTMFSPIYAYLW
uniref:Uncharacterized protein n=1 Tax=Rousettus aegyptiacus TaxID=9407 RepID=A0A7J8KAJ9_ROUAE|nr:hypothetical protein HJG63_007765 [Rousettus aegyptiacus]